MGNTNKICQKYYNEIKTEVNMFTTSANEDLASLNENIHMYACENPNIKYEDLVDRFGEPEEVAAMLLPDAPFVEHTWKTKLSTKRIIIITVMIMLIILALSLCIILRHSDVIMQNYYVINNSK